MKVVLDTNVLVSALIKAGKPRDLFNKLVKQKQLVLSRVILEEFLDVVEDPKIAKYTNEQDLTTFLNTLGNVTRIIPVKSRFKAVKEDPDDDIIVRTAFDGKAGFIVSGDRHLLALEEFKGIKILTVDEMLSLMNS
jgi:putative PIN family toxin of toxin-antitoxin system